MENIDAARKNNHLLLDVLMDSMPKMPEQIPEGGARGLQASTPEIVKNEAQGEKVDLLA